MYRDGGYSSGSVGGSGHSHEGKHRRHSRDHERRRHRDRESRREKADPFLLGTSTSSSTEEMQTSSGGHPMAGSEVVQGGGGGGGFEMGIPTSTASRRSDRTSTSSWFRESPVDQDASPHATPTYLSALALPTTAAAAAESDKYMSLMGVVEGRKEPEPQVPLWQEGWRPGPVTCAIPKLYEPMPPPKPQASAASISSSLDYPQDKDGNNLVLHCLSLQSYIQELKELLSSVPEDPSMDMNGLDSLPKKPVRSHNPSTKLPAVNPLCSPAKIPHLHLDKQQLSKLQRKSAAAICSFSGYESASPESLGILSDLLGSFLSNFTRFLKMNTTRHAPSSSPGCLGFQDALERSLQQMGMGGRSGLQQYWRAEVEGCAQRLEMEAEEYRNAFLTRTVPEDRPVPSSSVDPFKLLSSPFANSRLFSTHPQELVEQFGEEEMLLDVVMHQSRITNATRRRTYPEVPPAPTYTESEFAPPEAEGFVQLDLDGPPRKRIRTASLDE